MQDRPVDTHEGRTDNYVLIAIVLLAVVAAVLIIGSRMSNASDKSVDLNTAQPNIETHATGETKKP